MAGETLQVEIVDFYPRQNKYNKYSIGTLHVYIIVNGVQIDLRGAPVYRRKNKLRIQRPDFTYVEGDENVRFPVFMFTDSDLSQKFTEELISKGREFMEKNYPDFIPKNKKIPEKFRRKKVKVHKNVKSYKSR